MVCWILGLREYIYLLYCALWSYNFYKGLSEMKFLGPMQIQVIESKKIPISDISADIIHVLSIKLYCYIYKMWIPNTLCQTSMH